ncbi:MAG: hypothetical protein R3D00_22005 [Bacteroidia bacterium]
MKKNRFIIGILFLVSCNRLIDSNSTYYQDGKLFQSPENTLVDGVVVSHYANGVLRSEMTYSKGRPSGGWKTYGFDGEIIQQGIYFKDLCIDSFLYEANPTLDYLLSSSQEGSVTFATISLISHNKNKSLDDYFQYIRKECLSKYRFGNVEALLIVDDSIIFRKWFPQLESE